MKWFNCSVEETLSRLEVTPDRGVSEAEAAKRLEVHGRNELTEATALPPLLLFLVQFKNPMLIILLAGAALSAAGSHWVDAVTIVVIVMANAVITFVQELIVKGAFPCHPAQDRRSLAIRLQVEGALLPMERGCLASVPDDRHVLAAAIRAGADVIVTYNPRYCFRRGTAPSPTDRDGA